MKLETIEFINNNKDWQEQLQAKPYCIKIKDEGIYTILNYSQVDSNFSLRIVQECRGLIIVKDNDNDKYIPVCVPFFKFFNYGEKYVSKIDWTTAQVQEKIDGSLIKFWYHLNHWNISTNSMINAFNATIALPTNEFKSYGDLVLYALKKQNIDLMTLDKDYCYMFELVSPYTRIVVPYTEIQLYYLGERNMKTLEESNKFRNKFNVHPTLYEVNTLDKCIEFAKNLPKDREGFVVVDKNYNRIKVKSPQYVAMHHIRTNVATIKSILTLIKKGEQQEFINYFPEYKDIVNEISRKYFKMLSNMEVVKLCVETRIKQLYTRKEQAIKIQEFCKNNVDFAFAYLDNKVKTVQQFIDNLSLEKLEKRLENYE